MSNEIQIVENNGQLVVSSRQVAKDFGKEHSKVIRSIEGVAKIGDTSEMYYETTYINEQNNQEYKEYLMNRDGFSLLVMGFTGSEAMEWKLKYIEAFNAMERELKTKLPTDYLSALKALVASEEEKVKALAEVKELAPKAEAYTKIVDTKGFVGLRELAKLVHYNPCKIGNLLIELGLVYKTNNGYYPTSAGIAKGYVESRWKCTGWGNKGYMTAMFTIECVDYLRRMLGERK